MNYDVEDLRRALRTLRNVDRAVLKKQVRYAMVLETDERTVKDFPA